MTRRASRSPRSASARRYADADAIARCGEERRVIMQVGICTHLICAIVLAPHGTPRSVVRARSVRRPRLRPAAARIASNTLRTLMAPRRRGDSDAPAPSTARTGARRCGTRPHTDRRAAARRHDDEVAMRVDGRRGTAERQFRGHLRRRCVARGARSRRRATRSGSALGMGAGSGDRHHEGK